MLAAAGIAFISPDGLMMHLVPEMPMATALFLRTLGIAVTLAALMAVYYRGRMIEVLGSIGGAGLIAVGCQSLSNAFFVMSMQHTTVAETLVLLATMPFWSAVVGRLTIKEAVPLRTAIAIAVAFLGIVILVGKSLWDAGNATSGLWWRLAGVGAAITQGSELVALRKAGDRDMTAVLVLSCLLTAVCCLPFVDWHALTPRGTLIIGATGFVFLPIALALFNAGARYARAAEVALVSLVETVLGPLWVWLGLGEAPGTAALLGGALVIAAVVGNTIAGLRAARQDPDD